MGQLGTSAHGRIATSIITAPFAGILSYFAGRIVSVWGILDPVADKVGHWLKIHVTASDVGWAVTLVLFAVLYGIVLWRVWRPRHVHHLPLNVATTPVASLEKKVIRAEPEPHADAAALLRLSARRDYLRKAISSTQATRDFIRKRFERWTTEAKLLPADLHPLDHRKRSLRFIDQDPFPPESMELSDLAKLAKGEVKFGQHPQFALNPGRAVPDDAEFANEEMRFEFRRRFEETYSDEAAISEIIREMEQELFKLDREWEQKGKANG